MRTTAAHYKSVVFFSLLSLLIGCSPSEKSQDSKNQTDTSHADQGTETSVADDGWRKGTLRIEVEIAQAGGQAEGGVNSQWKSAITATSEEKVMVAPDLRPFVSSGPLDLKDPTHYEPYRTIDSDEEPIKSSEASHSATWSVVSDEITGENEGSFTGKANRLYVQALHPSLFGKGYEVYVKMNLVGKSKTTFIAHKKGGPSVNEENEKDAEQEIGFGLHPIPNADKLNDYQYLPEGIEDDLKQRITQQNMELLSLLQQSYADSLAVQSDLRAGLKSEATADQLVLTYEYSGNKQVGYAAMLGVNAGLTNNNKISVKVTLTANK